MPKNLLSTPLKDIRTTDILELVTARVEEVGRQIEFKLELKVGQDSEKKEFCTDVASFVNAIGGVMLVGIRADQGVASAVEGIEAADRDALVLRVEQILHAGISPRIPWVGVRAIDLGNGRAVLVIQAPQSPIAPHAVGKDGTYRFFTRGENGKLPMDIPQVRRLTVWSEGLRDRLRQFRAERVGKIVAGDGQVPLKPGPRLIFHVVPMSALSDPIAFDVKPYQRSRSPGLISIGSTSSESLTYNLDGVVDIVRDHKNPGFALGYTQIYQFGALIESVDANHVFIDEPMYKNHIHANFAVGCLRDSLDTNLSILRELGVSPPIYGMITLTGVRGSFLYASGVRGMKPCDRDSLFLPEFVMDDLQEEPSRILRSSFDAFFRSFGIGECPWYQDDGRLLVS